MLNFFKFTFICSYLFLIFIPILNAISISVLPNIKNSIFTKNNLDTEQLQQQQEQTPAFKIDKECDENSNETKILKKCDPCPNNVKCVPKIQCPAHVQLKSYEKPQICDLPLGESGYCCMTGQNHTDSSKSRSRRAISSSSHMEEIQASAINDAQMKFDNLLNGLDITQQTIQSQRPEFFHTISFHSAMPNDYQTIIASESAIQQVFASQILKQKEHISTEDFLTNNIDMNFHSSILGQQCPPSQILCPSYVKYRSFDGTCNNPIPTRAIWGAAGQPMERVLPPAYEDGIWAPRIHSVDGSLLTSTRDVSRFLFPDINRPHPRYNLLLMQFGQFVSHDVTQSASITLPNGQDIECCAQNGFDILPPHLRHFACLPIQIAPDDEFYSAFNQRCMNFVRLALAPNPNCNMGYGRQLSRVTHYLDGSQIYGSNMMTARNLREFRGGRLRMFDNYGRDLLPISQDRQTCGNNQAGSICFQSGDARTNQIISLTTLHTIFAREHNRIADILAHLNPHYSDEILYQETRRIVIAEYQHIIFNEWLPLVISDETMKVFHLEPKDHGYSMDYSTDVNAAVTNEFTGAAFRFGHSTVDGLFRIRRQHLHEEQIQIPDVMFNPTRLQQDVDFLNDLVRTLMEQPMQEVDDSITHGLSRFLFRGTNPFGLDLAAINIQRGRDHALRPYNDYLEVLGNRRIQSFNEFRPEIASKLMKVYRHPDDIDLWVGGLLEKSYHNSIVGQTFAHIIADQFSRLRRGDRYFYEHPPPTNPNAFNHQQLQEIRKITMARILCDNLDQFSMNTVSRFAFLRSDHEGNIAIRCDSPAIPKINFQEWKVKI